MRACGSQSSQCGRRLVPVARGVVMSPTAACRGRGRGSGVEEAVRAKRAVRRLQRRRGARSGCRQAVDAQETHDAYPSFANLGEQTVQRQKANFTVAVVRGRSCEVGGSPPGSLGECPAWLSRTRHPEAHSPPVLETEGRRPLDSPIQYCCATSPDIRLQIPPILSCFDSSGSDEAR